MPEPLTEYKGYLFRVKRDKVFAAGGPITAWVIEIERKLDGAHVPNSAFFNSEGDAVVGARKWIDANPA